jgi:lipoprotein-anchoring transpeptidase ErfK/SrfK
LTRLSLRQIDILEKREKERGNRMQGSARAQYFQVHKDVGCVRLLMSDAEWIYENIGLGASVEIRGGRKSE